MQFNKPQSEHDAMTDRLYAAMHTGNTGQAQTLLREYSAVAPAEAAALRVAIVSDFGVDL